MYIQAAFVCSKRPAFAKRRPGAGQRPSAKREPRTPNAGYLKGEVVCLRFQLLAPWLRRALYQVDTYAVVEEPAVHSGGKLAAIRLRYASYWASNISRAISLGPQKCPAAMAHQAPSKWNDEGRFIAIKPRTRV